MGYKKVVSMRYHLLPFTDTNSVIGKMIVGGCRLPLSFRASAHTGVGIRFLAVQSTAPPLAAGDADCHVAALLAMTMKMSRTATGIVRKTDK